MSFTPGALAGSADAERAYDEEPLLGGGFDGKRIIAPLLCRSKRAVTDQITVAVTLARTHDASLRVIDPTGHPDRTPTVACDDVTDDVERGLRRWALDQAEEVRPGTNGTVLSHRRLTKGVLRVVAAHDVDTLVIPNSGGGGIRRTVTERIATAADADVVVVNGQPGFGDVASILLPVAGGPHSGLATDLAGRVAEQEDAWVDVLHVVGEDSPDSRREAAEEFAATVASRLRDWENVDTWILEADDTAEAIIQQSAYYSLTVLGAPTKGRLRKFVFGSTTNDIRAAARSPVLIARSNTGRPGDRGE